MEKLVIIVHGKHRGMRPGKGHQESLGLVLTNRGERQMEYIGKRAHDILSENEEAYKKYRLAILCSSKPQTRESADIIASSLEIPISVEESEILYSDNETLDLPGALELVRAKKDEADVIILVTHQGLANKFLTYFGEKELGTDISLEREIKKAEGYLIDCKKRKASLIAY